MYTVVVLLEVKKKKKEIEGNEAKTKRQNERWMNDDREREFW